MDTTLSPAPVSTSRFTYMPTERRFVSEASDLGPHMFGRVWADACDEGLTLVSASTGRPVVCSVVREERQDGELVAWHLEPANRRDQGLFTVTIFND